MPLNLYDEALETLDDQDQEKPNPYLQILDSLDNARTRAMRTAVIQAHEITPDRAAQVRRISDVTGLAPEVVDRNFDDLSRRVTVETTPYAEMQRDTPKLAEWAADPHNAALAKDDMEQLGLLDWIVSAPPRAFRQGVAQNEFGRLNYQALFRSLTKAEHERLERLRGEMEAGGALGAGKSWFRQAVTGLAQQIPIFSSAIVQGLRYGIPGAVTAGTAAAIAGQLGPQVAAPEEVVTVPLAFGAGLTAGAVVGAGEYTAQIEAGLAYDEYLGFKPDESGRPLDPETAKAAALLVGVLNGMIEVAQLSTLANTIPGIRQLKGALARSAVKQVLRNPTIRAALSEAVKSYAGTLTNETAQEVAQRIVTITGGELAKVASGQQGTFRSALDIASDVAREAEQSALAFSLMVLPGPAMHVAIQSRRAIRAQHNAALINALTEGVANSKLAKRLPQAAQAFLAEATKDGPVETLYAPVGPFTQYWQSQNLDPREVAKELTGSTEAYDTAVRTGEDLAIPTAAYAVKVAGTEHHTFFAQELRLGPDEMNLREAAVFREQLAQQVTEAETRGPEAPTPAAQIRAAVIAQLEGAGVPRETAETYATLYEAALGTIAERAGLDPAALYARYGLTIARPDLLEATAAAQAAAGGAGGVVSPPAAAPVRLAPEAQPTLLEPTAAAPAAPIGVTVLPGAEHVVPPPEGRPPGGSLAPPGPARVRGPAAGLEGAPDVTGPPLPAEERLYALHYGEQREQFGFPGTPDEFRTAWDAIVEQAHALNEDVNAEASEVGADALLRTIRRLGGIGYDRRVGGLKGEWAWLWEGADKQRVQEGGRLGKDVLGRQRVRRRMPRSYTRNVGAIRGVTGVLVNQPAVPVSADRSGPRALDTMGEMLGESYPQFGIENGNDLVRELQAIQQNPDYLAPRPINLEGVLRFMGIEAGRQWWPGYFPEHARRRTEALPMEPETVAPEEFAQSLFDELLRAPTATAEQARPGQQLQEADSLRLNISSGEMRLRSGVNAIGERLAPEVLEATRRSVERDRARLAEIEAVGSRLEPAVDLLETGELQPRLPGEVGAVREQEIPTPEFEAPFTLKTEVAKGPREKQTTLFQQPAYHGSPYVFERFSLHAIGKGEGAQAYGWGLYFASKREIAQRYREQLSESKNATVEGGGQLPLWVAHELAGTRSSAEFQKNVDELITEFKARIVEAEEAVASKASQWWIDQSNLPGLRDIVLGLENAKAGAKISMPGRTYKVDLRGDEDFLDWDKPASEQSAKVQEALKALGIEWEHVPVPSAQDALEIFQSSRLQQLAAEDIGIRDELREGYHLAKQAAVLDVLDVATPAQLEAAWRQWFYRNEGLFTGRGRLDPTGEQMYGEIGSNIARAEQWDRASPGVFPIQQRASEALAAQGIAGIRYLDGFSRGTGAGSSNFVVFDDKLVQITEYYQRRRFIPRARPTGLEADRLNQELNGLTQQIRDAAPPGSRLEAFIDEAGEIFVANIDVPEAERAKGAGTDMMRRLLEWADDHNLQVSLDPRADPGKKGALLRFYRRLGFVHARSAPFYDPSAKGELLRPALSERQAVFPQERRGAITFGPGQQTTITLLERADLSTFLHESGHFFLNVFSDVFDELRALEPATLTAEQSQMLADYRAILNSLGVQDRKGLGEEQHEHFARMFEAYLMKGEAPSLELRSAFARFRAWLIGVYRTLRGLNVELSDQVRQVFDRMLATDDAIAYARAAGRVEPMFTTAESAGMSETQFGLYRSTVADASRTAREQLERKLMGEVQREQEATWKAQRAEIEAAVAGEVYRRPEYCALSAMQRGTHADGTPLVEGLESEPLKLSRALLVERYGEERLKRFPKPYIYQVEGGLDPDTVAQMFGFSSGDEMLTAIEQAPAMRLAIQGETQRRMLEEHGSLLLDGTLHEKAQAALANDDREIVIRAELRALAQLRRTAAPFVKAGEQRVAGERAERTYERRWLEAEANLRIAIAEGRKQAEIDELEDEVRNLRQKARGGPATIRAAVPPAAVLAETARTRIAQTKIRNLKPQPFWSASRRASQAATDAAARQDFEAAIVAKQQELINVGLYREAMRAQEDVQNRVRRAKQLSKPAARARLGFAGESYLDQVDGILDRYDFAKVSRKALDRRASLRKWVAALEGEGLPVDLPEDLLEETRRVNYQDLTVEELVGVTDGLQQIVHLAQLKNRLLTNARHRELDVAAGELVESIRQHARRKPREVARDRRPSEERRRMVGEFFAGHRKLASLLRELDGFEDGGAAWEAIMRPLNEAAAREAEMNAEATRTFYTLVETAFPGAQKRTLYTKMLVPAIGKSLSRMERLMVALNWGNEGNRDRVRRVERWTDPDVQAILDTLTPADLEFVQGVFDFINSYWAEIEAKQKRVFGVAPEKVEATPIRAAAGEIRGGYFPLKYDDRLSTRAIAALDFEAANLAKQAAYVHATTKRGHTYERQVRVTLPVRLDFGVMFGHVAQVIHDLTHHEVLIDVGRILGRPEVQQAIVETQGDVVYKQIRNTIRDVAFGDVPAVNAFERVMQHVRTGATTVALGWNLAVSMMQPLGLANSIVRIGPKWVGRGLARWLRSPRSMVETVHWIEDKSPMMRLRGRTLQREINEIRNSIGVNTGRLSGWMDQVISATSFNTATRQGIADSYFWLIQQMQRVADIPTWLGEYEKAMEAGDSEARAVARSDQAVLDSQGGGQTKDLCQLQRGGPLMRLWTNFFSYFDVVFNQAAESRRRTHWRNPAEVGRLASDYLMLFIVPCTLAWAVREALRPRPRRRGEESLVVELIRENLSYLAGTMVGLRELTGTLQGYYGYQGPAGSRMFAALGKLGRQVEQAKLDEGFWRSLNESAGVVLHYPASQADRIFRGLVALLEGKTKNPGALIAGPPAKKKK